MTELFAVKVVGPVTAGAGQVLLVAALVAIALGFPYIAPWFY